MVKSKYSVAGVSALIPYATDAQAACLQAFVNEGGNVTRAAARLGFVRATIRDAIKAAVRRAAARGYAPAHGWNPPAERTEPANTLPEGFRLKGVSELVNADGERSAAWLKGEKDPIDPPARPIGSVGVPVRMSTFVDSQGKQIGQWVTEKPEEADRIAALTEALRATVAEFVRPLEPVEPPRFTNKSIMALYPIGDPHIGMLAHREETGEDFDLKIAERDLCGAMDRLVSGMPRASVGVLIPIGDNFHADDDNQRTPAHHHKLDVDGRKHKVAKVGINIFRYMIDRGLAIHDEMHCRIVDGNHDPVTSLWLRLCLEGWYAAEPRVKIFTDPGHLQVWEFGQNMCGVCHGDGIKPQDMAGVMAARYREIWGRTSFHYGYQGHKHKREMYERHGALIEVLRTLAGKDSFAAKYGYESGRCLVGIVLHELFGEIERKTVDITLARTGAA